MTPMLPLVGKVVVSGCGETIGTVADVLRNVHGAPFALRVVEPDGRRIRVVELQHVRAVDERGIALKGPRQGYHIARLARDADDTLTHASLPSHGDVTAPSLGSTHVPTR